MNETWGWVDVFTDGWVSVGDRSKLLSDNTLEVTSCDLPAEVKTVMAMLDLTPAEKRLVGGSFKTIFADRTTYLIYTADFLTG